MKKVVSYVLLCTILLFSMANPIHAAAIPEKNGHIVDTANMIPTHKIALMQKVIDDSSYSFYILSIESLEGESSSKYATTVYNKWQLGKNDILLFLSKHFA